MPDLPAKPIIDIDVLLATKTEFDAAIDRLAKLGYVHEGNLGIPEREASLHPFTTFHITFMFVRREAGRFNNTWRSEIISAPTREKQRYTPI